MDHRIASRPSDHIQSEIQRIRSHLWYSTRHKSDEQLAPHQRELRRAHPRAYEPWTRQEENALLGLAVMLHGKGQQADPIMALSTAFERQPSAIIGRLREIAPGVLAMSDPSTSDSAPGTSVINAIPNSGSLLQYTHPTSAPSTQVKAVVSLCASREPWFQRSVLQQKLSPIDQELRAIHPRHREPWSREEQLTIRDWINDGASIDAIAKATGRTSNAVIIEAWRCDPCLAERHGIARPDPVPRHAERQPFALLIPKDGGTPFGDPTRGIHEQQPGQMTLPLWSFDADGYAIGPHGRRLLALHLMTSHTIASEGSILQARLGHIKEHGVDGVKSWYANPVRGDSGHPLFAGFVPDAWKANGATSEYELLIHLKKMLAAEPDGKCDIIAIPGPFTANWINSRSKVYNLDFQENITAWCCPIKVAQQVGGRDAWSAERAASCLGIEPSRDRLDLCARLTVAGIQKGLQFNPIT